MNTSEMSSYSSYKPCVVGILISILQMTKLDNKYKVCIILNMQSQEWVCTLSQTRGRGYHMTPVCSSWDFTTCMGNGDWHTGNVREDHRNDLLEVPAWAVWTAKPLWEAKSRSGRERQAAWRQAEGRAFRAGEPHKNRHVSRETNIPVANTPISSLFQTWALGG